MAEPHIERLAPRHLEDMLLIELLSFADPWSRESYRYELVANKQAYYFGCFEHQCLLGFGGFWQILAEGHITNIAVHPQYRGQGLAQLLLVHLMAACRALGGDAMTLEVRASNLAARYLYRKFGFKSAGIRHRYYNNGEDAVIMWVDLKKAEADHGTDTGN